MEGLRVVAERQAPLPEARLEVASPNAGLAANGQRSVVELLDGVEARKVERNLVAVRDDPAADTRAQPDRNDALPELRRLCENRADLFGGGGGDDAGDDGLLHAEPRELRSPGPRIGREPCSRLRVDVDPQAAERFRQHRPGFRGRVREDDGP